MKRSFKLGIILAAGLTILACSTLGVSRDESGSLLVKTNLSLNLIENMIENTAEFSEVAELDLELRDGYIEIYASEISYDGMTFEDVSFDLELFAENSLLSAQITEVRAVGLTVDDSLFGPVNQMLAAKLAESQAEMEIMDRAELVDVSISPEGIALVWRLKSSE